jgi:hypothetical protein
LLTIEALKDSEGNIVGAVNCFQDITERKRSEAQMVNLARAAEHRTKNILATVQAADRNCRDLWIAGLDRNFRHDRPLSSTHRYNGEHAWIANT